MKTEHTISNERSDLISELQSDFRTRVAYIQAKVGTLVPSQIRALRLKSDMPRQKDLAEAAKLHQSRISMFETAGSNPTLETLSTIAAALKVGLKVEFVPFSEMLAWENQFSQDRFDVLKLDEDQIFLHPPEAHTWNVSGILQGSMQITTGIKAPAWTDVDIAIRELNIPNNYSALACNVFRYKLEKTPIAINEGPQSDAQSYPFIPPQQTARGATV